MCLIVDANTVSDALLAPIHPDFIPLFTALRDGSARLVYGGKLTREYLRIKRFLPLLREFERSGRARKVSDNDVDTAAATLVNGGTCRSDDQHIIALAQIANVRLLCSRDRALIADFKDRRLLAPKGKVYQQPRHARLIRQHCGGL